jgi:hypothetical protein
MRAYQIHSSRPAGCCSLSAASQSSSIEQWEGGERCHVVPTLPERAKDFTPYPSSRRRRRR